MNISWVYSLWSSLLSWNPSHPQAWHHRETSNTLRKLGKTAFCPRNEPHSRDYNTLFTSESQNNIQGYSGSTRMEDCTSACKLPTKFQWTFGKQMTRFILASETWDEGKNRHAERRGRSQGMETQTERSKPSSVWPRTAASTGTTAVERLTGLVYSPSSPTNKPPCVASPRIHRAWRLCVSSWPRHGQINYGNSFGKAGKRKKYRTNIEKRVWSRLDICLILYSCGKLFFDSCSVFHFFIFCITSYLCVNNRIGNTEFSIWINSHCN